MFRALKPLAAIAMAFIGTSCATGDRATDIRFLNDQVIATEIAFAATMADRDFEAFRSYLATDAIFISGPTPLRGKDAVSAAWQRYFESEEAPFSWRPEQVVVLDSGKLALSSGPVSGADGTAVGTFTSVWRREADGRWRIVLDKGGCLCDQNR